MTPEKHKPSDLSGMVWQCVHDNKTLDVCELAEGTPHHAPVPIILSKYCRCSLVRADGGHVPEDKPADPIYAQRLNLAQHYNEALKRRCELLDARVAELESIESDFQTMEQRADAEVAEGITREIALKKRVAELEGKYESLGRMVHAPDDGSAIVVYTRASSDPYVVAYESTGGGEYEWVGPGIRVTNISLLGWTSIAPDKVLSDALEASRPTNN